MECCYVCREKQTIYDSTVLQCGHRFHTNCINFWWEKILIKACPYCRNGDNVLWNNLSVYIDSIIVKHGQTHRITPCDPVKLIEYFKDLIRSLYYLYQFQLIRTAIDTNRIDLLTAIIPQRIESLIKRGYFERISENELKFLP